MGDQRAGYHQGSHESYRLDYRETAEKKGRDDYKNQADGVGNSQKVQSGDYCVCYYRTQGSYNYENQSSEEKKVTYDFHYLRTPR
jgi:hypothetical protein